MAHQNLTAANCFEQPQVKTQNSLLPNKRALWFSVWERTERPSFERAFILPRKPGQQNERRHCRRKVEFDIF